MIQDKYDHIERLRRYLDELGTLSVFVAFVAIATGFGIGRGTHYLSEGAAFAVMLVLATLISLFTLLRIDTKIDEIERRERDKLR